MKPRVFIGSSIEKLQVANAIQENLEYDGNITIWNQGIFNLSSNALNDLLEALNNFDFAIFIFDPDDVSKIRNQEYQTVRDNIIFELGLFIGKLGRERVYYVVPRDIVNFRLPSDLVGITHGTYDNKRDDNNIKAALGPFCNQVRDRLKKVTIENLTDLKGESEEAKRLAYEKPSFWEYLLAAELLESKMKDINQSFQELENDLVVQRKYKIEGKKFFDFFGDSLDNITNLMTLLNKCLEELNISFGPLGVSGKSIEIKSAVERIIQICKELLSWEFELNSYLPPSELEEVKFLMKGWSKLYFDQINALPINTRRVIESIINGTNTDKEISIILKLESIKNPDRIIELFRSYLRQI